MLSKEEQAKLDKQLIDRGRPRVDPARYQNISYDFPMGAEKLFSIGDVNFVAKGIDNNGKVEVRVIGLNNQKIAKAFLIDEFQDHYMNYNDSTFYYQNSNLAGGKYAGMVMIPYEADANNPLYNNMTMVYVPSLKNTVVPKGQESRYTDNPYNPSGADNSGAVQMTDYSKFDNNVDYIYRPTNVRKTFLDNYGPLIVSILGLGIISAVAIRVYRPVDDEITEFIKRERQSKQSKIKQLQAKQKIAKAEKEKAQADRSIESSKTVLEREEKLQELIDKRKEQVVKDVVTPPIKEPTPMQQLQKIEEGRMIDKLSDGAQQPIKFGNLKVGTHIPEALGTVAKQGIVTTGEVVKAGIGAVGGVIDSGVKGVSQATGKLIDTGSDVVQGAGEVAVGIGKDIRKDIKDEQRRAFEESEMEKNRKLALDKIIESGTQKIKLKGAEYPPGLLAKAKAKVPVQPLSTEPVSTKPISTEPIPTKQVPSEVKTPQIEVGGFKNPRQELPEQYDMPKVKTKVPVETVVDLPKETVVDIPKETVVDLPKEEEINPKKTMREYFKDRPSLMDIIAGKKKPVVTKVSPELVQQAAIETELDVDDIYELTKNKRKEIERETAIQLKATVDPNGDVVKPELRKVILENRKKRLMEEIPAEEAEAVEDVMQLIYSGKKVKPSLVRDILTNYSDYLTDEEEKRLLEGFKTASIPAPVIGEEKVPEKVIEKSKEDIEKELKKGREELGVELKDLGKRFNPTGISQKFPEMSKEELEEELRKGKKEESEAIEKLREVVKAPTSKPKIVLEEDKPKSKVIEFSEPPFIGKQASINNPELIAIRNEMNSDNPAVVKKGIDKMINYSEKYPLGYEVIEINDLVTSDDEGVVDKNTNFSNADKADTKILYDKLSSNYNKNLGSIDNLRNNMSENEAYIKEKKTEIAIEKKRPVKKQDIKSLTDKKDLLSKAENDLKLLKNRYNAEKKNYIEIIDRAKKFGIIDKVQHKRELDKLEGEVGYGEPESKKVRIKKSNRPKKSEYIELKEKEIPKTEFPKTKIPFFNPVKGIEHPEEDFIDNVDTLLNEDNRDFVRIKETVDLNNLYPEVEKELLKKFVDNVSYNIQLLKDAAIEKIRLTELDRKLTEALKKSNSKEKYNEISANKAEVNMEERLAKDKYNAMYFNFELLNSKIKDNSLRIKNQLALKETVYPLRNN